MAQSRCHLNAWKHGGYSNLGVLPGEEPREFDLVHQSLIEEWEPSGPTECDIVLNLAKCMWRKSRLTIYAQAAAARTKWKFVFENREDLCWNIDTGLDRHFVYYLTRLKEVLPLWEALEKFNKKLRPQVHKVNKQLTAALEMDEKDEQKLGQKSDLELELANLGEQITTESLIKEIDLEARLDARIDRLLKRLYQVKAAKPMLGVGSCSHDAPSQARKLPLVIEQGTAVGQVAVDVAPAGATIGRNTVRRRSRPRADSGAVDVTRRASRQRSAGS
jgi:hypothetical protein